MKEEVSAQVKAFLRQSGFRAKKRLGQHFLVDEELMECILSAADISINDIVIEVGPGLGILTVRLAEMASEVIAVEIDSRLVSILRGKLASSPNVKIIHADILKVTPRHLLENYLTTPELAQNYKVVANLPYYITSPVIRHFLESPWKPSLMVIMVQKEVGEAIAAAPGKMSLLSVIVQFYSKPAIVAYVPAASFYPSPKVDSVVLRLDVYPKPFVEVANIESFFDIVRCGFCAPRKQLRNSLAKALEMPGSQVTLILEKAGIEAKRRAETLSLEEWKELWKVLAPFRK